MVDSLFLTSQLFVVSLQGKPECLCVRLSTALRPISFSVVPHTSSVLWSF